MATTPTLTMRASLKTVYNSRKWARKVEKMSDEQVIAIYHRLKQQDKL